MKYKAAKIEFLQFCCFLKNIFYAILDFCAFICFYRRQEECRFSILYFIFCLTLRDKSNSPFVCINMANKADSVTEKKSIFHTAASW